eukprot:SAG31_NODE_2797_length_5081_cov_11.092935_3_plen_94_part_00
MFLACALRPHTQLTVGVSISQTKRIDVLHLRRLPITVTGEKKTGSMQEQTAQCLQNVEGALRGAGVMSKRGIVKVTAYITNVDKWDEVSGHVC